MLAIGARARPLLTLALVPAAFALVRCTTSTQQQQTEGATSQISKLPPTSLELRDASDAFERANAAALRRETSKATPPAPQRPGMSWIPPGVLQAGSPPDRIPRVAEEEPAGTPLTLGGFFIDVFPYPNEPGAIPTTNVTRDEAARLCTSIGKRLCGEHEWERACKGPANSTYEYGDTYRASVCATGVAASQSARRPVGERVACKSAFGVSDMHGGAWEWTDSAWTRGAGNRSLYVLRGGNSEAGELAGRCANALARRATAKSPTMGFRCCAGPKNDVTAEFELRKGGSLERSGKPRELSAPLVAIATKTWGNDGAGAFVVGNAWTWRPVGNEEIRITSGCAHPPDVAGPGGGKGARCGVLVARVLREGDIATEAKTNDGDAGALSTADAGGATPRVQVLAAIDSGYQLSDVVMFGNPKLLRMWGIDGRGSFVREFGYSYGRVPVADPKRH